MEILVLLRDVSETRTLNINIPIPMEYIIHIIRIFARTRGFVIVMAHKLGCRMTWVSQPSKSQ